MCVCACVCACVRVCACVCVYYACVIKLVNIISIIISHINSLGIFSCMHIYIGTDRPALKYLNKYVKADIANKWHDIGLELLDVEDESVLNTIKNDFRGDADTCTAEMLQLWLVRKPKASWNDLIEAIREPNIKLNTLAAKLEAMLSKGIMHFFIVIK